MKLEDMRQLNWFGLTAGSVLVLAALLAAIGAATENWFLLGNAGVLGLVAIALAVLAGVEEL